MRVSRVAGGYARSTAARASKHLSPRLADIEARLVKLWDQVEAGDIHPRVGEVLCQIAARLLDFGKFSFEVGETRELADRLQALEESIGDRSSTRPRYA